MSINWRDRIASGIIRVFGIVVGGFVGIAGLFGLGLSLITLFAYVTGEPPTEPGYTFGGAIFGLITAALMLLGAGWLIWKSLLSKTD